MHKFLGDTPVSITCHACGKQLQKKIKWIKKNKTLKCKKCGKKIDLTKSEIKKTVKEVTRAISDFEAALSKLDKSIAKVKKHKASVKHVANPVSVDTSSV